MNNVVYVNENVTERVFEGDLILDGHMTPQAQRESIFRQMRAAGIPVENEDEFQIGYVGAEDNNGISETQTSHYVVTRTYQKTVPYREQREEIYSGSWILDGLRITPEEQRKRIIDMARRNGVTIENEDDIEIGYVGAEDNNGISETQSTDFVIYRVSREKLSDDEIKAIEASAAIQSEEPRSEIPSEEPREETRDEIPSKNDSNALQGIYEELTALRERLQSASSIEEMTRVSDRIKDLSNNLDILVNESTRDYEPFEKTLAEIDKKIQAIYDEIFARNRDYEDAYDRVQQIIIDYSGPAITDPSVYDQNVHELIETINRENEQTLATHRVVRQQTEDLSKLIKKKKRISKDLSMAKQLGISPLEYKELTDNFRSRKLVAAIIEQKGLGELNAIPAKERTPEQQKQIKEIRRQILEELAQAKKENKEASVLDLVEALYGIETEVKLKGKQRVLIVKPNALDNMRRNIAKMPEKVAATEAVDRSYVPGAAPEDMKGVMESRQGDAPVRHLPAVVVPTETLPATISPVVDTREAGKTYTKEMTVTPTANKREILPSEQGDELIPGTTFKKPRARKENETDEEYVAFLKDYYDRVFGSPEENMTATETPTEKEVIPEEEEEKRDSKERYTIFRDADHPENLYARKFVFNRFDIEPIGEGIRVGGALCYQIDPDDLADIEANANNDYSPYYIEYTDIRIADREQTPTTPTTEPVTEPVEPTVPPTIPADPVVDPQEDMGSYTAGGNAKEKFVIYRDADVPNKYYAYKPVFDRFGIDPIGEEVKLNNVAGYEIAPEDVQDIVDNQDNDYSPYEVEFRDISFGKERLNVEFITLYRDTNDNNQVYAPDDVLARFGLKMADPPTTVNGEPCHKISRDTDQIINSIAKMSKDPKIEVRYVDVQIKQIEEPHVRPHVETIIDKLTDGLDIRAKDAKHYQASNLQVAAGFRGELQSGNYAYNIVHVVPAVLKAGMGVLRKLFGKVMTHSRAKEAMAELEKRLNELSEEELEVLFEEYKGSQLKTDMNNQINPLILDRLRRYGLEKVEALNQIIKQDYTVLFALLGQIKALEEKIQKGEGDVTALENERKALMQEAATHVRSIIDNRNKANNILSSGVHGLEEDFKAVSTKLSYVGMRFGKDNDFDNELQHRLGELGQGLNTAIANGDNEGIVQNFMGLESCYYENTEIRGSIAGRRSVGSKYYSPIAEQFDYRDDPFIRDLFTTIAVTSSAISAINAIRIHQIEAQRVIDDEQARANAVNAQNQATMSQVHQTGRDIAGRRGTFREGMEAQAQQDILQNANVRERAHLDLTNWRFNKAYRAADDAGHVAFNQFNADVTREINAVTSDYAQGLITQAEALQRMAQISSDAQSTLNQVVTSCLQILRTYKKTHPQFDLTAPEQAMSYMLSHPNAIANMNQAAVDVTNMGESLLALQATPMAALTSLPSDMASTLVCAASASALAYNVAASMQQARKKGRYGNEITDMMDDYLSGEGMEEEEEVEMSR